MEKQKNEENTKNEIYEANNCISNYERNNNRNIRNDAVKAIKQQIQIVKNNNSTSPSEKESYEPVIGESPLSTLHSDLLKEIFKYMVPSSYQAMVLTCHKINQVGKESNFRARFDRKLKFSVISIDAEYETMGLRISEILPSGIEDGKKVELFFEDAPLNDVIWDTNQSERDKTENNKPYYKITELTLENYLLCKAKLVVVIEANYKDSVITDTGMETYKDYVLITPITQQLKIGDYVNMILSKNRDKRENKDRKFREKFKSLKQVYHRSIQGDVGSFTFYPIPKSCLQLDH